MRGDNNNIILVVDDNRLIRTLLKDILKQYNLPVELAINGKEATTKWEKGKFKIILMDIEMPLIDGLEATRIIRKREQESQRTYTPIIGISGAKMLDIQSECLQAGMDAFVPKPIYIDKVAEEIFKFI